MEKFNEGSVINKMREVTLIERNEIENIEEKRIVCVSEDTKITDIYGDGRVVAFEKYYPDGVQYMINGMFPYIIKNDHLCWSIPYEQVTFNDFLNTHADCIENDVIYIDVGFAAAGGRGILIGRAAWKCVLIWLRHRHELIGGILEDVESFKEALAELGGYYEKADTSPIQQIRVLVDQRQTGILAIQEILNYDEYNAQRFLKGLGFSYKDGIYSISPLQAGNIRNLLNNNTENQLFEIFDELGKNDKNIIKI